MCLVVKLMQNLYDMPNSKRTVSRFKPVGKTQHPLAVSAEDVSLLFCMSRVFF
ncbi:hypothetical protein DSBG_1194 [Desulfosporosinus sp. BG]|nr:hypothetical protein DSBG_1194 [Desulfosporosinus sp. BG]